MGIGINYEEYTFRMVIELSLQLPSLLSITETVT